MATSLLLDRDTWDLTLTSGGDMALATEPYALEQDVASECRVFAGECYYDTTRGIPYFEQVLGQSQPIQVYKEYLVSAAKRVPGVDKVEAFLTLADGRHLGGQIQFGDSVVGL